MDVYMHFYMHFAECWGLFYNRSQYRKQDKNPNKLVEITNVRNVKLPVNAIAYWVCVFAMNLQWSDSLQYAFYDCFYRRPDWQRSPWCWGRGGGRGGVSGRRGVPTRSNTSMPIASGSSTVVSSVTSNSPGTNIRRQIGMFSSLIPIQVNNLNTSVSTTIFFPSY